MNESVEEYLKAVKAGAYDARAQDSQRGGTEVHSVVFRKSDGGIVVTHHENRDSALETAAEIRAAFPWVPVSIVPGTVSTAD
jgi:hypothetical protein